MRQMPYAATTTLLLAAVFACSPRDRQETAARTDTATEDIRDAAREGADEVRDNAREGANDVRDETRERDYAYAERSDFRRDIDLRLKEIDDQIAELQRDTKLGV